jgi:glycosyltransferase involved in cell wall biosynthesis
LHILVSAAVAALSRTGLDVARVAVSVGDMEISIVIPAYRAQATIARAVASLVAQRVSDWEAIVVSDDGSDYAPVLRAAGIADERLRFVATGGVGSGCHRARNVGLAAARGRFVGMLDADDLLLPDYLDGLQPLARAGGAAFGNVRVVADASGAELQTAFSPDHVPEHLDIAGLLDLSVPLLPLVAREHALPRLDGIEFGEDFVANLRLIDRLGPVPVAAACVYEYRVVAGSLCHDDRSADAFEKSYTDLIERLDDGDRLGLSAVNAALARERLLAKRDFNRAFAAARRADPTLDFQTFAARRAVSPSSPAPI